MTNKHFKRCSKSLAIREMQNNHDILYLKYDQNERMIIPSASEDAEQLEILQYQHYKVRIILNNLENYVAVST